jgi:hypothetical protein
MQFIDFLLKICSDSSLTKSRLYSISAIRAAHFRESDYNLVKKWSGSAHTALDLWKPTCGSTGEQLPVFQHEWDGLHLDGRRPRIPASNTRHNSCPNETITETWYPFLFRRFWAKTRFSRQMLYLRIILRLVMFIIL